MLHKIQGTQAKVMEALGMDEFPWKEGATQKENAYTIGQDTTRTPYIDANLSFEAITERWKKAAGPPVAPAAAPTQEKKGKYAYTQGDMDGALIPVTYLGPMIRKHNEELPESEYYRPGPGPLLIHPRQKNQIIFKFGYRDDKGRICGHTITYAKGEPNKWIASTLQNATAPHDDRLCTVYFNGITPSNRTVSTNKTSPSLKNLFPFFSSANKERQATITLDDLYDSANSAAIADLLSHCFLLNGNINERFIEFCIEKATSEKCTKPIDLLFEFYPAPMLEADYTGKKQTLLQTLPPKPTQEEYDALMPQLNVYREILERAQGEQPESSNNNNIESTPKTEEASESPTPF